MTDNPDNTPSQPGKKKQRVAFRYNRAKPARKKDWTRQFREQDEDQDETVAEERVKAKGDLSRKRTIIETDGDPLINLAENQRVGTAIAVRGQIAEVDDGCRIWPCTVRRILRTRLIEQRHPVAVGDQVIFTITADKEGVEREGVIERVAPRHGTLSRRYGDRVHTIVANVDQVIIVASANYPPIKPHLIDRYIVSALAGDLEPIVCVNKIDLDDTGEGAEAVTLYRSIGHQVLATSALTGQGLDELRGVMKDNESVLAGQSGVGKSSLLNVLQPSLNLTVGEMSQATAKGRHTTSTARLLRMDFGGYVVDTPGVRSFELAQIPANELEVYFVEFADRVADCKFPNCTHIHENGCAIQKAVADGQIDEDRYESYVRMFTDP